MINLKDVSNLRLAAPLEFKFQGDQQAGIVSGYASIFGFVDSFGEMVEEGAFEASLARHKAEGTVPAMLWSHDPSTPIGKWLELAEDAKGLRVRGALNLDADAGRQAFAHIKNGDVGGLSIGFVPKKREPNNDGSISLLEIELLEVSVVAMAANRRARIIDLKQATTIGEFEAQLRGISYSRAEARQLALRGWPKATEMSSTIDLDQLAARIEATTRAVKSFR